jgi:hypothetical protein
MSDTQIPLPSLADRIRSLNAGVGGESLVLTSQSLRFRIAPGFAIVQRSAYTAPQFIMQESRGILSNACLRIHL